MQSRISVIDTHTGGEPTRIVIAGGPELGGGSVADRLAVLRDRHDTFRSAVVNEPRGSDVMVGAILVPPDDPECVSGVIYFNNIGYLGMCGHGTIGVAVALAYLGRIGSGSHRLDTPIGQVTITLDGPNSVNIDNVESYRLAKDVSVTVPGPKTYVGDIAWGGNWFFLVKEHGETLSASNVDRLAEVTWRIRRASPRRVSQVRRGRRSTTSNFLDHPPWRAPTARTSCFAPAGPTTAPPVAPEPAPSLPA